MSADVHGPPHRTAEDLPAAGQGIAEIGELLYNIGIIL